MVNEQHEQVDYFATKKGTYAVFFGILRAYDSIQFLLIDSNG